ncbi:medium-chain acyl-CoA ligase ACSF2, mitochondrial-like [Phlebotomus papatasi]|uniref:medium-chain acyl-CoA ligase ACSF2, mitochondrial-like n=1 Tax=Phlebotomus papatasi TaxID=29031 RepID=UPI00248425ED|nr:medium-chain acyl-CoA ligase ACSF2, mitochondrial-like [Phlebotomus papatasi]
MEPLVYRTVGQELSRVASEFGDHEAYVCVEENKRFTYDKLKIKSDRLAAGFSAIGLTRGDRIGIWAPNVAMWPVVAFAAARAGLILVTLNPAYEPPEMEFVMKKVGIKTLVTSESFRSEEYYEKLLKIVPELDSSSTGKIQSKKLPLLSSILIDSDKYFPGTFRLTDVEAMATTSQINEIEDQQKTISPDSGYIIQFTSGTTGAPKAALLKHFAIVNSAISFGNLIGLLNAKICAQVPFFHIYGVVGTIMASLSSHATAVLPSIVYNPDKSLISIKDEECQVIYGTPTMYVDLVSKQREKMFDLRVKTAITGGALCPAQLCKDMKNVLKLERVQSVYGMTETTGLSFASLPNDTDEQGLETIGYVLDHVEVKVIDKEGNPVPFGTPGELCTRGYLNMLKYWDDEEKTKEIIDKDGWLRTEDQFVLQEDGYGKIIGRLKEIINRGGENIYPKEIENFLATCPQIAEVNVLGVPDERLGEEICAFVRLRVGSESFTEKDIKEFCKGKIAFHKIPRYIEIVTEFPKTLSGKVQKFKLQEEFSRSAHGR